MLLDAIEEYHVEKLYVLGDLCESKDGHDAWMVNSVVDHLALLAAAAPLTILRGNHDYLDPENPFFGFLQYIPRITYINQPTVIGRDLFLPHTRNHQRDWVGLQKCNLVFAHNTFAGAVGANGHKLDGIPPDAVDGFIISGDVHVPQQLGRKLIYVGAPYTINFGDDYEPRALLWDADNKLKSIPLPGPQKRVVEYSREEIISQAKPGDIVKLCIHLAADEYQQWNEIKETARRNCESHGWIIDSIVPIKEQRETVERRAYHTHTDDEVFTEYCRRQQLDRPTVKTGDNLMKRAV